MQNESQTDKWNRGLTLFEESVLKPEMCGLVLGYVVGKREGND